MGGPSPGETSGLWSFKSCPRPGLESYCGKLWELILLCLHGYYHFLYSILWQAEHIVSLLSLPYCKMRRHIGTTGPLKLLNHKSWQESFTRKIPVPFWEMVHQFEEKNSEWNRTKQFIFFFFLLIVRFF